MEKNKRGHYLQKSLKSYAFCAIFFFLLLAIFDLLFCFTPLPEAGLQYYTLSALVITCLLLGIMAGAIVKKKGIFFGAAYAGIFLLLLLLAVFSFGGMQSMIELLSWRYLICLLAGGIGGILGVNQRN